VERTVRIHRELARAAGVEAPARERKAGRG
jgi:hypothetical protein